VRSVVTLVIIGFPEIKSIKFTFSFRFLEMPIIEIGSYYLTKVLKNVRKSNKIVLIK